VAPSRNYFLGAGGHYPPGSSSSDIKRIMEFNTRGLKSNENPEEKNNKNKENREKNRKGTQKRKKVKNAV
jgi:hypothetical protein